jgi:UDP-glucose 4-epimerase
MILITGGAGYIGSHAVRLLLENGEKVMVIDNLYRGYKQAIETLQEKYGQDNLLFFKADLRNFAEIDEIISKTKPEAAMHFAALCLVNESMEKPTEYFENNVGGTINLLKSLEKNEVKYLVFSSTCAVYGESQYLPVDEKHPTNPVNPYGESKLISEKIIKWESELKGLKYVVMRYFNVSGASSDGLIGDSKRPSQLLMQNAVRGALGIEEFKLTCPKVDTKDGTPIRDYIDVEDLVAAHVQALNYLKNGGDSEVFNLGTGKGNSVLEIVEAVKKSTGVNFPMTQGDARKGEYAEIYANNEKAKKILNWTPRKSLAQGVESLVKWYKKHPKGWDY